MPTNVADEAPPEIEQDAARGGEGRFRFIRAHLKILALLLLIMGAEAAVIYMLPQPMGTAPRGDGEALAEGEALPVETVEVEIGQFQCTNSVAVRGSLVHINFDLNATVASNQATAFANAVKSLHKARVRQAVVQVARSSSMEDLKDPELNVLKRQLKEEVNKAIRKTAVNEIVISDFRIMEQ